MSKKEFEGLQRVGAAGWLDFSKGSDKKDAGLFLKLAGEDEEVNLTGYNLGVFALMGFLELPATEYAPQGTLAAVLKRPRKDAPEIWDTYHMNIVNLDEDKMVRKIKDERRLAFWCCKINFALSLRRACIANGFGYFDDNTQQGLMLHDFSVSLGKPYSFDSKNYNLNIRFRTEFEFLNPYDKDRTKAFLDITDKLGGVPTYDDFKPSRYRQAFLELFAPYILNKPKFDPSKAAAEVEG